VLPVTVSQPLAVAGLALQQGEAHTALIANLTDQPQMLRVAGLGASVQLCVMNDIAVPQTTVAGELKLTLGPYAFAQLDW
jgi:hypothetical protein